MSNKAPGTNIEAVDASNLAVSTLLNAVCIQSVSARGVVGKPELIATWREWLQKRGGLIAGYKELQIIKRILDAKFPIYHARVAHLTDPTDLSSVEGTKATATLTVTTNDVTYVAEEVGDSYNGITVTTAASVSGVADQIDITVNPNVTGVDPVVVTGVNNTPDDDELEAVNKKLRWVQITTFTNLIPNGTATLATGAIDLTDIVAADYVGDQEAGTGWWAFAGVSDAFRIASIIPGLDETVDEELIAYLEERKDMRGSIFRQANNLTEALDAKDYRNGVGAYSHTAFDSLYCDMAIVPKITINNAQLSGRVDVDAIGDLIIAQMKADAVYPWLSPMEDRFKKVVNNYGIRFDIANPSYKTHWDLIYTAGINAVGKDFGDIAYIGNRSLFKDRSKLFQYKNVCDLVVDMVRTLKPIANQVKGKPGHPDFFRLLYLAVQPYIRVWENNYGINPGWIWNGDQNAETLDDVVFNTRQDIEAGIYKFQFIFTPIVTITNVEGTVVAADSITLEGIKGGNSTSLQIL